MTDLMWPYVAALLDLLPLQGLKTVITFVYYCFLQPLGKAGIVDQAGRLDRFYQGQSDVYDKTRGTLLRGRERMLRLVAADLAARSTNTNRKPIWIDVGGGTGWNVEQMDQYMSLDGFERIYLVDLCQPLLEVARKRLARFPNVVVVHGDATVLEIGVDQVDVVTMSYSLSMIPPYFKVVDRVLEILSPGGIVGVVDFFTSNKEESELGRQGNLINRLFWRSWFEFDHVDLNPARRDYLSHKFECVKSASFRNDMVLSWAVSIPYYVYLGRKPEELGSSTSLTPISETPSNVNSGASITRNGVSTPDATPLLKQRKESQIPELVMPGSSLPLVSRVATEWPEHRLPFDPTHPEQAQFGEFIYSFVWEDPDEDVERMSLGEDDDMLVITSAGCNALDYLVNAGVRSIQCVDMNPCQGHLLELKIAAFRGLSYADTWALFGEGKHPDFPALLDTISPYMSAEAYRFWCARQHYFDSCFYRSGYAGNVLKVLDWLFYLTGTTKAAKDMATAGNIVEQRAAWKRLRKAFISNATGWVLLANPVFLWKALGVPVNQFKMLLSEGSALQYAIDTLDPIAEQTLLSKVNFHYLLPLLNHYTRECCPAYLKRDAYDHLSRDGGVVLDALTLHTDTINNVLQNLPERSLSKAIVMDHQDWFDVIPTDAPFPHAQSYLDREIELFKHALKPGGEVWWRSAAKMPWYADRWEKAGFQVDRINSRDEQRLVDKVNMYASLWRARLPVA